MNRVLTAVTATLVLAACNDGAGPEGNRSVALSMATPRTPSFAVAAGDTVSLGANTLIIDRVQLVLREIELERADDDACDSLIGSDDRCEEFEAGPVLVDLPLGGQVATLLSIVVDTGTYDELEFELHKPSDSDTRDAAFVAANPGFADISVRVTGSFNGVPFIYTTDVNADQEIDLVPPLVITPLTTSTNVTLQVDVSRWFVVNGVLINPATANKGGPNESAVNNNIQNSFEAFEDEDRDGDDDGDDH